MDEQFRSAQQMVSNKTKEKREVKDNIQVCMENATNNTRFGGGSRIRIAVCHLGHRLPMFLWLARASSASGFPGFFGALRDAICGVDTSRATPDALMY